MKWTRRAAHCRSTGSSTPDADEKAALTHFRHRLNRVDCKIGKDLLQLNTVGMRQRQAGRQLEVCVQIAASLPARGNTTTSSRTSFNAMGRI